MLDIISKKSLLRSLPLLTEFESKILDNLIPNKLTTYSQLINTIWGMDEKIENPIGSLYVHIFYLRDKGFNIHTNHGIGLILVKGNHFMTKRKTNLERQLPLPWSRKEVEKLIALAPTHNVEQLSAILSSPPRTPKAIHTKLRKLKLSCLHRPKGFSTAKAKELGYTIGSQGSTAKSEFGYLPPSLHPDWSKVKFS